MGSDSASAATKDPQCHDSESMIQMSESMIQMSPWVGGDEGTAVAPQAHRRGPAGDPNGPGPGPELQGERAPLGRRLRGAVGSARALHRGGHTGAVAARSVCTPGGPCAATASW